VWRAKKSNDEPFFDQPSQPLSRNMNRTRGQMIKAMVKRRGLLVDRKPMPIGQGVKSMATRLLGAMSPRRCRCGGLRKCSASVLLLSLACGVVQETRSAAVFAQAPVAAGSSPYYTDPATGIVYRKVHRTIERPVVQTEVTPRESTIYRPETVVEVTPETRTVYSPVVSYGWEPRVRGRWNPFVQPTLQYEHVPRTHWEARSETVERRQTRTNWVAERRRVDVPQQVVKIQREEKVDYEAIGRVAPQQATPPNSAPSTEAAIAARLRPIDSASTRSIDQAGLRATDLNAGGYGGYSTPLPPVGVAANPLQTFWR